MTTITIANIKNLKLKINLIGREVPDKRFGAAGRAIEYMIEAEGFSINRQATLDNPFFEVKSRDLDCKSSAQTIGSMLLTNVIRTEWEDTTLFQKIQIQFRVKTRNNIIVSHSLYDFRPNGIQNLLKGSYNLARRKIINFAASNVPSNVAFPDYIGGGDYGYFERKNGSDSWDFRIRDINFKKLEGMAKSTFFNLFSEEG
jgi:hypothetical protein